jgi:hypothetical protein
VKLPYCLLQQLTGYRKLYGCGVVKLHHLAFAIFSTGVWRIGHVIVELLSAAAAFHDLEGL